jgi:transposase
MVIDEDMWSRLEKLLPKPKGRHGKDERLFMEAICWMLRTGAAWRDLPPDYGNWPSPQPSPAKSIIILSKLLARERGQIEVKLKICAQSKIK